MRKFLLEQAEKESDVSVLSHWSDGTITKIKDLNKTHSGVDDKK